MVVKAAAELALSALRYSHLLSANEIYRGLGQCKEQGGCEMLQRALTVVEQSVREAAAPSGQLLEIWFTVARRWDELYHAAREQQIQLAAAAAAANSSGQFGQAAVAAAAAAQVGQLPFNLMNQPAITAQILPLLIQQTIIQAQQQQAQQQLFGPKADNKNNANTTMGIDSLAYFPINPFLSLQQQQQQQIFLQNMLRQHQAQQQQQHHLQAQPIYGESLVIDEVALKYLMSAFRVGMLGLEALPRRADGVHQLKYRQNPSYADDVKWLFGIAIKLGKIKIFDLVELTLKIN